MAIAARAIMVTTPRSHQPRPPERTPAASAAVSPQDIDQVPLEEPTTGAAEAIDEATSTADHGDLGRETGELYGQGIAPIGDVDDDGVRAPQDFKEDEGETWTEALHASTTEVGPAGQAPIDDVRGTEADERRARREKDRDRPVADRGSGGPGGL